MEVSEAVKLIEENLEQDINDLTPEKRIGVYLSMKEFLQPKLQRTSAAPVVDVDREFKITIVNGDTSDESVRQDPDSGQTDHLSKGGDEVE